MTLLSAIAPAPARPGQGAASAPIPAALAAKAGVGLRLPHHAFVQSERPDAAWLEVHPENYMTPALADELAGFAAHYPLSLHAVGLSLGSAAGLDHAHLLRLKALERRVRPALMSDHLSWSVAAGADGPVALPDLLPLPYTEEALAVVIANVDRAQAVLERMILVENPSTYLRFAASTMEEPCFLGALVRATGCGVLLDVNNIYVSAMNQGEDPGAALEAVLAAVPHAAIGEIHLAGHAVRDLGEGRQARIDDHGSRVRPDVWALYETAIQTLGPRPTLIEWDTDLPAFAVLQEEAAQAQAMLDRVDARGAGGEPCLI
jgi:uncharacterized protein (UPF0276 family)